MIAQPVAACAGASREVSEDSTVAETHHEAWMHQSITVTEFRRRRLRDFLPVIDVAVSSDDERDSLFACYRGCYEASWHTCPDVDEGLDAVLAFGLTRPVLTNGAREQQNAKVRRVHLRRRLAFVMTAENIGVATPHERSFSLACSRLSLDPGQVLHVGANHGLDVLAARHAGLQAAHLARDGVGPFSELIGCPRYVSLAHCSARGLLRRRWSGSLARSRWLLQQGFIQSRRRSSPCMIEPSELEDVTGLGRQIVERDRPPQSMNDSKVSNVAAGYLILLPLLTLPR